MKIFILLACLVGLVFTTATDYELLQEWNTFKLTHGKTYDNAVEEEFRKVIFTENRNRIARHHQKYLQGLSSFDMAMNQFGDLLHHEFVLATTCMSPNYMDVINNGSTFLSPDNVEVPKSINWVVRGYVTPVKNQGECGSCYSFSATGALEGQHKRKTGKLVSLSEQNIVDCSSKYGNKGCEGGLPQTSFEYIKDNKGVDTEDSYPYKAEAGKCSFKRKSVGATDKGFASIKSESEKKLQEAVGTVGPVAVGIDASQDSFQFYSEGVYDEPACSSQNLGHAVLAVGYGKLNGSEFWLVKNSWGTTWGKSGYVRMSRNKDNQCGIATMASYPLV